MCWSIHFLAGGIDYAFPSTDSQSVSPMNIIYTNVVMSCQDVGDLPCYSRELLKQWSSESMPVCYYNYVIVLADSLLFS